ncbi:MAG: GNAT family N-acetyltransferase [Rhodospirillaceae bacterium]|jgi:RimJ/RimL family protein N-acetyltransferase|nr:GNAT family N-acetyltransferase [Rhodospirillaceae bacterium]MBT4773821.1 GNAT family N-acetyltransferase [Rhodospirillaceae bacterium]MBT5357388.1 GNAT family N-acetyltransferase [Rhodospirillaceae bacterium]MBT5770399.1 GNAT family N-acetyltransferase [Rhodospirillaceae bacterium]MBT6310477.1 GNAT family N-acetyltransferase [Rhodospirillaceae bacterium]
MIDTNELGQSVGVALPDWMVPPRPPREALAGRFCRLEPLDIAAHAADLHRHFSQDTVGRDWSYLPYGPFDSLGDFETWMAATCFDADPFFYAIVDETTGRAAGMVSYMRITPAHGSIEVGHVHYAPAIQRGRVTSEAMYLMMRWAFEAGYRRYEWKCHSLNLPSRVAAQRLGFSYEGVFRDHMIHRGRSRDTAWYACVVSEWPGLKAAFETWLDPANFDHDGVQKKHLSALTRPILVATDPELEP